MSKGLGKFPDKEALDFVKKMGIDTDGLEAEVAQIKYNLNYSIYFELLLNFLHIMKYYLRHNI